MTHDQRAFGFDSRVIQLNFGVNLWLRDLPAPHLVSRAVRSVVHPLKDGVRAVLVGAKSLVLRLKRNRADPEASTTEEKSAELLWVAVVVEVDVLVGGEESVPVSILEGMWVGAGWCEDHEVGDVDDTDAEVGGDLAKESGGGDDLADRAALTLHFCVLCAAPPSAT